MSSHSAGFNLELQVSSFQRLGSERMNPASPQNVDKSLCLWRCTDSTECQRGREEEPLSAPTPFI